MAKHRRPKKNYIVGVYNYCDRMCEHCPVTERCRVFDDGGEGKEMAEKVEVWTEEFWARQHVIFERTMAMLYDSAENDETEMADERARLLAGKWRKSDEDEDDALLNDNDDHEAAESHPCAVIARAYGDASRQWMKPASAEWATKDAELAAQSGEAPESEAAAIRDAFNIILWHQDQIWVKLMRALSGIQHEEDDCPYPKDSDGSAKVALLAVERSIAAWGTLQEHFPAHEQAILRMLRQLYQLRGKIEAAFPNARAFVRPWFDEQGKSTDQ